MWIKRQLIIGDWNTAAVHSCIPWWRWKVHHQCFTITMTSRSILVEQVQFGQVPCEILRRCGMIKSRWFCCLFAGFSQYVINREVWTFLSCHVQVEAYRSCCDCVFSCSLYYDMELESCICRLPLYCLIWGINVFNIGQLTLLCKGGSQRKLTFEDPPWRSLNLLLTWQLKFICDDTYELGLITLQYKLPVSDYCFYTVYWHYIKQFNMFNIK